MITFQDIEENSPNFLAYMEEIDRRLRGAQVPIPSRPLAAFREIAKDGMQMIIGGPFPTPHADRINEWFKRRYGNRLLVDLSIGKAVVMVRGDPYIMRVPLIYGNWDGVIDVTKTYGGMTKGLFQDLPERDRAEMVSAFVWFMERFQKISYLPRLLIVNIDTAIQHMTSQTPHYGESQWASLQAAEKTLKEFIKHKNANPPWIHELDRLLRQAEGLGLPLGYWPILTMIQCSPAVRYDNNVTLEQAVLAHHASIDLCAFIADHLKPDRSGPRVATDDIRDMVISFGHAVDTNNNGGLLFRFIMVDGKERRLLFNAQICFFLRKSLRNSLAAGRHPDDRVELRTKRDFRNVPPRHPVRVFLTNQPQISARDFEQPVEQVKSCDIQDCTNAVVFTLDIVGGTTTRLIMDSPIVNYFADYLDGGIQAGREADLFVD